MSEFKLRDSLRTYLNTWRYTFRSLAEYRGSLVAYFITTLGWNLATIGFWYAIFQTRTTINGWTFQETLLMLGFLELGNTLWSQITVYRVIDYVLSGDLDISLTKPMPLLPYLMGKSTDISSLGSLPLSLLYLYLGMQGTDPIFGILGFIYMLLGVIVLQLIETAIVSLSFKFGDVDRLLTLYYNAIMSHQFYPVAIYPIPWKALFAIILPIGLIQSLPAQIVAEGRLTLFSLASLAIALAMWGIVARKMWKWGLKKYESAGG